MYSMNSTDLSSRDLTEPPESPISGSDEQPTCNNNTIESANGQPGLEGETVEQQGVQDALLPTGNNWVEMAVDSYINASTEDSQEAILKSFFDRLAEIEDPIKHVKWEETLPKKLKMKVSAYKKRLKIAQRERNEAKAQKPATPVIEPIRFVENPRKISTDELHKMGLDDLDISAILRDGKNELSHDAVVYILVRNKFTPNQVKSVFYHYPIGSSLYSDSNAGDEYLSDTIRAATAKIVNKEANPYSVDENGRIVATMKGRDDEFYTVTICDFNAKITQVVKIDGVDIYRIEGVAVRGGAFSLEIAAENYADDRQLKAALNAAIGPKDAIFAEQGKHLGPAIKKLSEENIQTIIRFTKTGWKNGVFIIPGREREGVNIQLNEKQRYHVNKAGNVELGLEALENLLLSMTDKKGAVILSALFQAPLARVAGWHDERYGLFIRGQTGSQKTSNMLVAMGLYGEELTEEKTLIKFGDGATRNAIGDLAIIPCDLPMLLDNYKPSTGDGEKGFVNLMHNLIEGSSKDRMKRTQTLNLGKTYLCWPVCTGESVPTQDAATLARLLMIEFEKKGREQLNLYLTKAQSLASHLSSLGYVWIDWLESEEGQKVVKDIAPSWTDVRAKWAEYIRKHNKDSANIFRIASNLATNLVTWKILQHHPVLGAFAMKYMQAHRQGLATLANSMGGYTSETLEGVRFITRLRELIAAGRALILRGEEHENSLFPNGTMGATIVGYADGMGGAYLLPDTAIEIVKKSFSDNLGNYPNSVIYDHLKALGWLHTQGDGKPTFAKRLWCGVRRVAHIDREALTETDPCETEADEFAAMQTPGETRNTCNTL